MKEVEAPNLQPLESAEKRLTEVEARRTKALSAIDVLTKEIGELETEVEGILESVAKSGKPIPAKLGSLRNKIGELADTKISYQQLVPKLDGQIALEKRAVVDAEAGAQRELGRYWGERRLALVEAARELCGPILAELKAIYGHYWKESFFRDLENGWNVPEPSNDVPRRIVSRLVSSGDRIAFEEEDRQSAERHAREEQDKEERKARERLAAQEEKEEEERREKVRRQREELEARREQPMDPDFYTVSHGSTKTKRLRRQG